MEFEEDKKLYKKFISGDKEAIEVIIKKYEKNLKYFILKYVKDIDVAEDIFQSVIVYILENKEKYDENYSLKTYLYTIAKSRALNYIKKQSKEAVEIEEQNILYQEEKMLEDIILSKQRQEKIINIMKKMSSEYQQVIYLTIIEGLSYQDTAQIMEKTVSQIKNLSYKARKKMRKLLVEEKVVEMKNNKIIKLLVWAISIVFISSGVVYAGIKIYERVKNNANLTANYTSIMGVENYNSIWVGTFNLVWNELMNEYVKGNIEFEGGNTALVDELNKQGFKKEQLSEEDYYIKMGFTSNELKEEILRDIKNKFNVESSNLLEKFSFEDNMGGFTIYSMLYKNFEFPVTFDRVSNNKFGNSENKVKYFGILRGDNSKYQESVEVLFYNEKNDFAIKLDTKEGEEIILYRTDENKSFNNYYEEIEDKSSNYEGNKEIERDEELEIPYINLNSTIKYDEVCNKKIKGKKGIILANAVQDVTFILNESGGKLVSEAMVNGTYSDGEPENIREFYFNDTFIIFMKEKEKLQPYMSLKVDNTEILVQE